MDHVMGQNAKHAIVAHARFQNTHDETRRRRASQYEGLSHALLRLLYTMQTYASPAWASRIALLFAVCVAGAHASASLGTSGESLNPIGAKHKNLTCDFVDTATIYCSNGFYYEYGCVHQHYEPGQQNFYIFLFTSLGLVLFAGLMSGLTMGLLSLDIMNLTVMMNSGEGKEALYASRLMPIVKKRHFLLVTLVLSNAAAMEALPIFLDRITNPIVAIVVSTTLVLVFGEIIPQAMCRRYGLSIGANLTCLVKFLMFVLSPIAWPISVVLDWIFGTEDTTFMRRAELKELVLMHAQYDRRNAEPLLPDEVAIIKGALDMRNKVAREIMTPISRVMMLDVNGVLDERTMQMILEQGHSRIPVYDKNPSHVIGILLVKSLIMINPTASTPIRRILLRQVMEFSVLTPLYDILHAFQMGKGHMGIIRDKKDVVGLVTLEDVIAQLVQSENGVDIHRGADGEAILVLDHPRPSTPTRLSRTSGGSMSPSMNGAQMRGSFHPSNSGPSAYVFSPVATRASYGGVDEEDDDRAEKRPLIGTGRDSIN